MLSSKFIRQGFKSACLNQRRFLATSVRHPATQVTTLPNGKYFNIIG